jgi:hypothetical protein
MIGALFISTPYSYGDPLDDLRDSLPEQVNGWKAVPKGDRFFDRATIFDYIDGEGEVYRAYSMRRCLSRSYVAPGGPKIVLDLFDMGSSRNAFGVFTHDLDGDRIEIGQGGLYRYGWLRFWKDRFFVSLFTEEEIPEAERSLKELARRLASAIPDEGPIPGILSELPSPGQVKGTTRYFYHPDILNYHYYVSEENILGLGPRVDAVLSEYERGKEKAVLFLAAYPEKGEAQKALREFFKYYLPGADGKGVAQLEDGKWSGAVTWNTHLCVIFESDSRNLAEDLLKQAMEKSP